MKVHIAKLSIIMVAALSLQKAIAGSEVTKHLSSITPIQKELSSSPRLPGENKTVKVFKDSWVQFEEKNHRVIDIEVNFPKASKTYSSVIGHFSLKCPNQTKCDYWDRYGNFGFVINKGTENEYFLEADRFITAYRVGFSWKTDFTALRPLFTGKQTMRVFIDTWVGEGHAQGDGWLFNASVEFVGGQPPQPEAKQIIPIWPHLSWKSGQPDKPVHKQVLPVHLKVPVGKKFILRSFISGHGWNNRQNCAEFCPKTHFYMVADSEFSREVWRTDCWKTKTDGVQRGTWQYSRAGWCPGAQVYPWQMDVTHALKGRETAKFAYRLEDFEWLRDGDVPFYYMSGLLIVY